jgi:hypothetical protein
MGPARGVWGGSSDSSTFTVLRVKQASGLVRLKPVSHASNQG